MLRILGCLFLFVVLLVGYVISTSLPEFEETRKAFERAELTIADRNGEVIYGLREDFRERRLPWLSLDQYPPTLVQFLLTAEDRSFHDHLGFSPRALVGSLWGAVRGQGRGGSTITMQLVRILDPVRDRNRVIRKLREIVSSLVLERYWSKEEILEGYLNLVPLRGELRGMPAGAGYLFRKAPHGLTLGEQAVLVALLPAPNAEWSKLITRAGRIAPDVLLPEGFIREGQMESYRRDLISMEPFSRHIQRAGLNRGDQSSSKFIRTTLDGGLQRKVEEILRRQVQDLVEFGGENGAALVVDNESGEVLAYVGGVSRESVVDGVQAPRQAGSTLKPFLYGVGFEARLLTPESLLLDAPREEVVSGGSYRPSNYDRRFSGEVTARAALASSLNLPTLSVFDIVGGNRYFTKLREFGFSHLGSLDRFGSSAALGSVTVSLWELVGAYRTLARGGKYSALRVLPEMSPINSKIPGSVPLSSDPLSSETLAERRVLSEGASFLISHILSDRESRAQSFGLENALSTRGWSAVKTGTSRKMVDNWCVGYTTRFTVGVWVGNFSGRPMRNVSGVSGAAPAFQEILALLPEGVQPSRPEEVLEFEGRPVLRGTEGGGDRLPPGLRIVSPVTGAIFSFDPDIPRRVAKIPVRLSRESPGYTLRVRGGDIVVKEMETGSELELLISVTPGEGRIELLNPSGEVIDQVRIQVRGG